MFDKDITIFAKIFDSETRSTKFKKIVINEVFIEGVKAITTSKNGIENADSVFISIPFECITESFNESDIVVKGVIEKDYQTLKDIQSNCKNVYTITKIDEKDFGGLPHYEVYGK